MKKSAWLVLSLVLSASPLFAAEIPAQSRVSKVTVYTDRALVTRAAEVELQKGDNAIVLEGLPAALLEDSLRAEGQATVPVTLEGAEVKRLFLTQEPGEAQKKLQDEIQALNDQIASLEERQQAISSERQFLDSIRQFSGTQTAEDLKTKSSTAEEWAAHAAFLRAGYEKNGQARLDTEKELRLKRLELDAKYREQMGAGGPGDLEKKTVVVGVTAQAAGSFKLELHYVVPQANWTLSYDAKVDPDKKTCALVSYGNVRQWSGENWTNAQLTLSSAKPSVGGRLPDLAPWIVDFYRAPKPAAPAMAMRRASMEASTMAAYDTMDGGGGGASAPEPVYDDAVAAQAEVAQDMGVVTFKVAKPVTVSGDNRLYKTPVQTQEFATPFDYRATPKLSPYAFLHAEIANDKDAPIPAGEMNVFVRDAFIGKSWLKTTGRGEKFDLYLGIDEEIKVERVELKEKRKKAMLGLKSRKDYGYRIDVENYKKEAVKVGVSDQIPVSRNAEIKVELLSAAPEPTEKKDMGELFWQLDVPAAAKKSVEFAFFVEHPSDKEVPGV